MKTTETQAAAITATQLGLLFLTDAELAFQLLSTVETANEAKIVFGIAASLNAANGVKVKSFFSANGLTF